MTPTWKTKFASVLPCNADAADRPRFFHFCAKQAKSDSKEVNLCTFA